MARVKCQSKMKSSLKAMVYTMQRDARPRTFPNIPSALIEHSGMLTIGYRLHIIIHLHTSIIIYNFIYLNDG
jgi:hypothetical protein